MLSRLSLVFLVVILIAAVVGPAPVRAQDDPAVLNFDQPEIVTLVPGQSLVRSFAALAGDRFDLRVIALAPITYSAALLDPQMSLSPLTVDSAGSATITVDPVTLSGRYTLLIQPGDVGGDMVLQLSGAPILPDPLAFNATTPVTLTDQPQRFRLEAQPAYVETLLTFTRLPAPDQAEPVALPRVVLMEAETGRMIAVLEAGTLPGASLRLPGNGVYFLAIEPGDLPAEVEVRWEGAVAAQGAGGHAPGGGVTGATATFTPFPSVTPDETITVTPTVTGTLTATYTPDPNATATAIPSPTAPGEHDATATVTYTPSYTPTLENGDQLLLEPTYTPTYTPTVQTFLEEAPPTATLTPTYTPTVEAQVAPPDGNYTLLIPLDSTSSVTDFVSYPGGDTEDRVFWDVSGMNPNAALSGGRARLVISASCFGTGTQHITFSAGGQTFSCGQTIVDREITYDTRTGSAIVSAVGGTGTYVQWALTATVTRVN